MTPRARATSSSRQRIVAAYSSKSNNSKSNASAAPMKRQMAVINWENVLVPLDWMIVHLGLGTSTATIDLKAIQSHSVPGLPRTFAAIEDGILDLLTEMMQSVKGPVFIVSAFPTVYVEFVCYLFFPRLTAALRSAATGIYVNGTPDTQLNDGELKLWRVNLLRTMVLERVFAGVSANDAVKMLKHPTSGRLEVLALCATKLDVAAMSTLHSDAPYSIVKSVRVKTRGTIALGAPVGLEAFYKQLQTLTQFVKQAVAANHPINIAL